MGELSSQDRSGLWLQLGMGLNMEQRQSRRLKGCRDSLGCSTDPPQCHASDVTLWLRTECLHEALGERWGVCAGHSPSVPSPRVTTWMGESLCWSGAACSEPGLHL